MAIILCLFTGAVLIVTVKITIKITKNNCGPNFALDINYLMKTSSKTLGPRVSFEGFIKWLKILKLYFFFHIKKLKGNKFVSYLLTYEKGIGLLQLGVLVNFVSHAVIVGFVSACSITIAVGQVPKLFGIKIHEEHFVMEIIAIFKVLSRFYKRSNSIFYFRKSFMEVRIGSILHLALLRLFY